MCINLGQAGSSQLPFFEEDAPMFYLWSTSTGVVVCTYSYKTVNYLKLEMVPNSVDCW